MTIMTRSWLGKVWTRLVPAQSRGAATFYPRVAPGAAPTVGYALTHVKEHPGKSKSDIDPAIAQQQNSFVIFADDLDAVSAPVPKVSDKLTYGASSWQITKVDTHLLDQAYFCTAIRER